ncbi:hypothetical protein RJ639_045199 [Escallonia herrerae]|uniref:SKP1 component dimerisation domain-containing protein n=1 Tax=Escallonia herrerae TaxID=1293975 RepID=A0AA88W9M6_9ASTE|nr:hypothetical protein RJ639_045199 [Escallonia herrerae]
MYPMSDADRQVIKPEIMKSYIWLQTADDSLQEVEQEVATFCPFICHEIHKGMGSSKNYPISLPQRVNPGTLSLILDYCRFHQVSGRSNKERKSYDEKFIRMDTKRLCELTSAADSLQLRPLVDLTSRALARMIEGKTPEEIRETFHLPDDLTEEEKLEPLRNFADDPRIRLLNTLYARKRKELKERGKPKSVEVEGELVDDRSVDDLLSFINGGTSTVDSFGIRTTPCGLVLKRLNHGQCCSVFMGIGEDLCTPIWRRSDSKGVRASKSKKKNRRRKDQLKHAPMSCSTVNSTSSSNNAIDIHKESNGGDFICHNSKVHNHSVPVLCETLKLQDIEDDRFAPEDELDDLDPAMKEIIDREVEDFARRLNSDWHERIQELLSLDQERRPLPITRPIYNLRSSPCASYFRTLLLALSVQSGASYA